MLKKAAFICFIILFLGIAWKYHISRNSQIDLFSEIDPGTTRIYDEVGVIPRHDIRKFEQYLDCIFIESDVDIRFIFTNIADHQSIETMAADKMQTLGIGGKGREERGLLLLYDLNGKRLRIEVGYGLESFFPDAFISYLVHDHVYDFLARKDLSTGLRFLIRMLHDRIREAILGNEFDPRVVDVIRKHAFLSGGAGVTASFPLVGTSDWLEENTAPKEAAEDYTPQKTPEATYIKYLEWQASGRFEPRADIFTPKSQRYLESLPMSKAYFEYILMLEYGKKYQILSKGSVAILCFTNDPLVCPHFFIKSEKGWQMDIVAEVLHTRERVGGIYTWEYRGPADIYTQTFLDQLINIKNYVRLKCCDNREIPVRNGS